MLQDVQPLGVSGHDSVLNTIVDHLHKVASAVRSAVEIPLLCGSPNLFTSRSAWCCINAWSQGREDRIEILDNVLFATDHQAIAAFESPHTAACSAVHIVDTFRFEFSSAPDIIMIVRIAAINDHITRSKMWDNGFQCRIYRGSRYHEPDSARRGKLADQV